MHHQSEDKEMHISYKDYEKHKDKRLTPEMLSREKTLSKIPKNYSLGSNKKILKL